MLVGDLGVQKSKQRVLAESKITLAKYNTLIKQTVVPIIQINMIPAWHLQKVVGINWAGFP